MSKVDRQTPGHFSRPVEEVLKYFDVKPDRGLSEAEVQQRRERHGPNRLREAKRRGAGRILIEQFKSMVIIVLVIAGALAFSFQHWAEGIAIAAVLLVNAGIGFLTEWKAVRSMEALREMGGDTIRVRRNGIETEIQAEELVPGDIIVLEAGDLAPADVRLVESNNLRVNEAALTGESVPVLKQVEAADADAPLAERTSMLYRGTTVNEGSGQGVVTATGMDTELGHISELAESAEKETTPLQKRLDHLGRRLAWMTLGLAAAIAGVGLLAGQETEKMIETAIALGVAAIPEGLPIVATIALARGMYLMVKKNALINKLPAVETLGATRVIFTDKTGTLTENQMTLCRISSPAGDYEFDEEKKKVRGENGSDHPLLHRILEVGVLCNNAALVDTDDDREPDEEQGDPTETALLRAGFILNMNRGELLEQKPEVREVPFDSDAMMMATFHRIEQGIEVDVKGAPNRVLDACVRMAGEGADGDRPLEEEDRREWHEHAEAMAGDGLRLLAVADKVVDSAEEEPYEKLRFLGLIGLLDPPARRCGRRSNSAEMPASESSWSPATSPRPPPPLRIRRRSGGTAIIRRQCMEAN